LPERFRPSPPNDAAHGSSPSPRSSW
jgi:hypothetical protein